MMRHQKHAGAEQDPFRRRAMKLKATSGSAIGTAGGIAADPTVAPGYSAMCSGKYKDSNPQASAWRAMAII